MYYIINEKIALRSWWLVPYAYYIRHRFSARFLNKEEFEFLAQCDGITNLPENELSKELCSKALCHPIEKGSASMSEWQKPMDCNNRYMPSIIWMITGHCNYNCIHCFNAADNAPIQSEFSLADAEKLMDDAKKCGINSFTITGGEPMAHKHFLDIIRGIYSRDMYVSELNTNGFYITQNVLDEMKQIGCFPVIKISFDGCGYHDIIRDKQGAEEDAIRAISLCVENGFSVMIQMQINRINKDSILRSLELMSSLGVQNTRIIRTSESPRWIKNAPDKSLSLTEYYDTCLNIAKAFMATHSNMSVNFWQFMDIFPSENSYSYYGGLGKHEKYQSGMPTCRTNRGRMSIASDGNVYPCLQLSGWCSSHGLFFGNVLKDGLQTVLQDSDYMKMICYSLSDLANDNEECRNCPYFKVCLGGCRALASCVGENITGPDPTKCLFYKKDYPEKIRTVLSEYKNLTTY